MELKEFNKVVSQVNFGARKNDKYTSRDFQCDLTGGIPVCLVWNKLRKICWLEYPEFSYDLMDEKGYSVEEYEQVLADWGVHNCPDEVSFNLWLDTFGKENVESCFIDTDYEEDIEY